MENSRYKFRAWNNKTAHWIDHNAWLDDCEPSAKVGIDSPSVFQFKADWTIEQFTGVVDMDGYDIYEGDIISDPEKMYVYKISYNAPLAGFIQTRLGFKHLKDIQRLDGASIEINHMTVIGNIHE